MQKVEGFKPMKSGGYMRNGSYYVRKHDNNTYEAHYRAHYGWVKLGTWGDPTVAAYWLRQVEREQERRKR